MAGSGAWGKGSGGARKVNLKRISEGPKKEKKEVSLSKRQRGKKRGRSFSWIVGGGGAVGRDGNLCS